MAAMREGKKPTWPHIKPKPDIQITHLKGSNLFTVANFLTRPESKAFIDAAESLGFAHQGSLGPAKGEAFRDNDRISVNDPALAESLWQSGLKKLFSDMRIRGKVAVGLNPNIRFYSKYESLNIYPALAESLWQSGLKKLFSDMRIHGKVAVGLNPNIRFYRYKVGQRFGRHIDESVDLGGGRVTHYTLLIYLSGKSNNESATSLVGGETVFYDRRSIVAEVAPIEGMALLHIHGDKCLLHEARTVTKNVKYVMRSDVVFA